MAKNWQKMAKTFTRWLDRIFSARNPFSTWWSTRRENSFFQLIPKGIIIRIELTFVCVKIKIHSKISFLSVYFCIINFYHNRSNSSILSLYFWAKCLSNTWLPHNSGQHRVRLRSCSFRRVRDWICAWKLNNMDFSKNCNIHIFTIVVFTLLKFYIRVINCIGKTILDFPLFLFL